MAARQVNRKSATTKLVWGQIEASIGLYKMTSAVGEADFELEKLPAPEALDIPAPADLPDDPLSREKAPTREESIAQSAELARSLGLTVSSGTASGPPPAPKRRRGLYREDGTFMDLTDRLEAITAATKLDEMKVIGFVPSASVPRVLVRDAYYVGMEGLGAAKALKALERGMTSSNVVALVKWTKTSRQALGVLSATRRGLVALQLAWPEELLEPSPRVLGHRSVELAEMEEGLARDLVHAMTVPAAVIYEQADDAVTMRRQLRAVAESGLLDAWEAPSAPVRPEVESLLDALRASIPADGE